MQDFRIGVHLGVVDAPTMLARIKQADAAGMNMAWATTGGIAPDPLAVFTRAAVETEKIGLGTSIVPTYPRHPLALAQSALALEQLSPGGCGWASARAISRSSRAFTESLSTVHRHINASI